MLIEKVKRVCSALFAITLLLVGDVNIVPDDDSTTGFPITLSKTMKILVIAPNVDMGIIRGDAIHLRNVVSKWSRNQEVHLIAATEKSDCPDGVDLVADTSSYLRYLPNYLGQSLNAFLSTLKAQRDNDYDLIYERHNLFDLGTIGTIFDDSQKTLEVNGLIIKEHEFRGAISPLTAALLKGFEFLNFRIADRIICVSPRMADDIRSKGIPESKISVVTNGCDPEIFRPRENAKEELGWDEETSHIGFVGTLSEWQGVDKVIKALPYIIEKNEKIKFIIVGDGPERDNLEDLVKAQGVESMVEFTGNFPHERVPLYMSAFDVGMNVKHPGIPSSPLKLYEYLACGTPVVGTDNEDFEPLDDDSVGGKANYESPKDIAENIVDVLNRKGPAMSKDARNRAINSSWEKVAEKSLEAAIN